MLAIQGTDLNSKAIIFDFDGVIVDTETPIYQTWQSVFGKFGVSIAPVEYEFLIGSSESSVRLKEFLQSRVKTRINWDEIDNFRCQAYRKLIDDKPVQPSAVELVTKARRCGIKTGLATSSPSNWIDEILSPTGLARKDFDAISTKNDTGVSKPSPAIFIDCLKKLKVQADHTVAIEDSNNGVRAACCAGLQVIVVSNGLPSSFEKIDGGLMLESLSALSIVTIGRLLANNVPQSG